MNIGLRPKRFLPESYLHKTPSETAEGRYIRQTMQHVSLGRLHNE